MAASVVTSLTLVVTVPPPDRRVCVSPLADRMDAGVVIDEPDPTDLFRPA
jgi:hypothetical protein